jgi:aminopeptidase
VSDPRPERLARLLGGRMLGLTAGQSVVIEAPPVAAPLVEALTAYAGRHGAHVVWLAIGGGYERAVLGSTEPDTLAREHRLHSALMSTADALVGIDAAQDATGLDGIPAERYAAWARGRKPGGEIRHRRHLEGKMQWAVVGFPCPVHAADAGMDLDEYADLVYAAAFCDRDGAEERWDRQGAAQGRLVERLTAGRELRIVAPGTDLTLRVEGRTWLSSAAATNIPDGEVFTGPHEDSAEGVVTFPFPVHHAGRRIDGVRLVFERGLVVEARADAGQDVLDAALATDAGARRLGEVGIGANYALPRFTGRTLLDEKIGGTVHLALGSSYPETGGTNVSALHWDLVCDLRGGGELLLDGRAIQQNGRFVPELALGL